MSIDSRRAFRTVEIEAIVVSAGRAVDRSTVTTILAGRLRVNSLMDLRRDFVGCRVALACNARTHLRDHARAIAGVCSLESLSAEGGEAGLVLFDQIGSGGDTWGMMARPEKTRVTLAG